MEWLHDITDKLRVDVSVSNLGVQKLPDCPLEFWTDFLRFVAHIHPWDILCKKGRKKVNQSTQMYGKWDNS